MDCPYKVLQPIIQPFLNTNYFVYAITVQQGAMSKKVDLIQPPILQNDHSS